MSSAKATILQNLGDIRGAMYDFEKSGDILPKHNHDETTVHITIVARGKIKAYSHDWEKEAVAGQMIDFRPREPHEIMALEDNTRIFNIVKKFGGTVNDYSQVATDETATTN
jgi:quercetin dioxygenase-like cupin family protein